MATNKGFNSKTKHAASYPDIPPARRPVDHCTEVPISVFSGLPSLQSEDSSSSQDEHDMVTDLVFHISTSLELSLFKQEELNDLVRNLCLSNSNQRFRHQGSNRKLFSAQIPKLLCIEIEKQNFFNTLFQYIRKMISFTVTMSTEICWQWVCQNMNQLIGDSSSTIQNKV